MGTLSHYMKCECVAYNDHLVIHFSFVTHTSSIPPHLPPEALSASMVDSDGDDDDDEESEKDLDLQDDRLHHEHAQSNPTVSPESGCGKPVDTAGGREVGVSLCVSRLRAAGLGEELQWLEAYLLDEARDRTMDGKGLTLHLPVVML